jgi:hypothetical protein
VGAGRDPRERDSHRLRDREARTLEARVVAGAALGELRGRDAAARLTEKADEIGSPFAS